MTRSCPDCDKIVKSLNGLSRHRSKCPVRTGKEARVIWDNLRPESDQNLPTGANPNTHEREYDNLGTVGHSEGYTDGLGCDEENDNWVDIHNESLDPTYGALLEHDAQGRLSSTALIRTETYKEATSVKASELLHRRGYRSPNYKIVLDKSDLDHLAYLLF